MLAQDSGGVGELAPVFAWLSAFVLAFGPGAIGITKLVDAVRSFDKNQDWPKLLWVGLALAFGVVICLVFQINIIAGLVAQLPSFSGSHALDGVAGQVVTGLAMGGTASYWHERMDLASSTAKAAEGAEEVIEPPL